MDSWDIRTMDLDPRQAQVLRTDDEARIVVINLPAGEALQEHQVHERAYVVVAGGEVEIDVGGTTATAGPGFLAHFEPKERHEVRARSDSRLLLFLAPWPGPGHSSERAGGGPPG